MQLKYKRLFYPICKIDHVECTPVGLDSFGQISSGAVVLTGHLYAVKEIDGDYWSKGKKVESLHHGTEMEYRADYDLSDRLTGGQIRHPLFAFKMMCRAYGDADYNYYTSLLLTCIDPVEQRYERIGLILYETASPRCDARSHRRCQGLSTITIV